MKVLKIVGIALITLVAVFFILAAVAPKEYRVERTVLINAPKDVVFDNVKYWKNWGKWSPWGEMDPQMVITVEGPDGTKGSKYVWEGTPELTGKGEMINKGVKELEEISYRLRFILPWEGESDGYVRLSDKEGKVEAAWGFYGEYPYPANIMLLFISMEDMMKKDFDRGLELLKNISEKEAAELKNNDAPREDRREN
ncbi:MAG: SRPBCC family protein [Rhodothermaceae bacterium]